MPRRVLNIQPDTANTPWSLRIATSALSRYPIAGGQWHYKDGLLFKAIFQLYQQTGDKRYWQSLVAYGDRYVSEAGDIDTYSLEEYNLDQINPGKILFPLYESTGQDRFKTAIFLLRKQLQIHPRTHEGGFWHKHIYPYQVWLDGIYMCLPFYAQFAVVFDEPAAFDDISSQIIAIEKHTRDPHTGLLYHAWDESHQQPWANAETGCSPHFWGRAIGWYVMAIVDVLDYLPQGHASRPELIAILERTVEAVASVQDKATGLWWQILDQSDRPGNYLEASCTSMFVYAVSKAVRNGYLEDGCQKIARRGFKGLLEHMVTIDGEGMINLHGICASAGLGGSPYRDGSFEYYVNEPIATNDLHGIGPFILAAIEMEIALDSKTES